MATIQAVAARRAIVLNRLEEAKKSLQDGKHFAKVEEQLVTNRDLGLAEVQRLENVAEWLEAAVKTLADSPSPLTEEEQDILAKGKAKKTLTEKLVGVHENVIDELIKKGYDTPEALKEASDDELKVPGVGAATIAKIRELTN